MHNPETDLLPSALRALQGNIPASLRAFSAEYRAGTIHLRSIFDETATDAEVELLSIAAAEIIADFPALNLEEEYLRGTATDAMAHLALPVFLRDEG
ncbi:MAG TPA: hypothetical protein PLE99_02340 [Candidatus Thiothrix moscowensis]|uniref:hypothetical protein n=1 Tax=unclassified Thiothrix TaxID=2636184 RepID=UPI0025F1B30D|nr:MULTISPECIES: hypothetical protein [unclassified Thiothrix]HRJ51579.1 hypothetical protein [Candidatus Thiothrix moscowensis]HRJ91894.1 hypothetical protein [Candidatus Thiothrix moscowensis]